MLSSIILIIILIIDLSFSKEYGLLFEHDKSYFQTSYITLCDETSIKFEVRINKSSGILLYAENRVRGVRLEMYFDRPGVYAKVIDGRMKYVLSLTLDFFSSDWYGWHDMEIRISKMKMLIMVNGRVRESSIMGNYFFPENLVEENEIFFGVSPRLTITRNVTGFSGYIRNIMYKSCGCNEWRSVVLVNVFGVSTEHLGDCQRMDVCNKFCNCYLFPWGSKRCECPDLKCRHGSNVVSYDFEINSANVGRLQLLEILEGISYTSGINGKGIYINGKNPVVMFVASGRSCFKNIFLCEDGFTHSLWILPKVTNNPQIPSLILKHSSTLESIHGLTITRERNNIFVTLITNEGLEFKVNSSLQLSIWSLITIIYNKTHLSLYLNSYLKDTITKYKRINLVYSDLTSTRFLFIGNDTNPYVVIDNFTFTSDVDLPNFPSIQELRLEQHSTLRKLNLNCISHVEHTFVNLLQCYKNVFKHSSFSEFYISILFNLQMEKSKMILIQSSFINITSETYKALYIDLRAQQRQSVKLRVVPSRLYYIEVFLNAKGDLVVIQNINIVLHNVTLDKYILRDYKTVTEILVNKDRNVLSDIRLINVNRDFATRALRIITGDITSYSIDFELSNIDEYHSLQLIEGYIGQGLELKYPFQYISAKWFNGACLKYVASCYHGLTLSFYMKLLNDFQHFNKPVFNLFSSGDKGLSLMIEKQGLHFIMIVEGIYITKFIPSILSFELYQWCLVEMTVSPNGIPSLFLNGREAQKVPFTIVPPYYECSQICLRDENDEETNVVVILDEMRAWNVERDFLYSNGYLSSDSQSLLQQQKNYEQKIVQLKVKNKSLEREKRSMKEELDKLKLVRETLETKIKSIKCQELSKQKNLEKLNYSFNNINSTIGIKKSEQENGEKTNKSECFNGNLPQNDFSSNLTDKIIEKIKIKNQEKIKIEVIKIKKKGENQPNKNKHEN